MKKLPSFFIGHGSPMNAIEDNLITKSWSSLGDKLTNLKAILVISAHWCSESSLLTSQQFNKTIHDFYGFPQKLMEFKYLSNGSIGVANDIQKVLATKEINVELVSNVWGIDHGVWSILTHAFPNPQVPILQLSIQQNKPLNWYFEFGKAIGQLREDNILILGSGNIVHNLNKLDWYHKNSGYDWAVNFDKYIIKLIKNRNYEQIINYKDFGEDAVLSVPTLEHFLPLLYVLGLAHGDEEIKIFNQIYEYGSLSMTSLKIG